MKSYFAMDSSEILLIFFGVFPSFLDFYSSNGTIDPVHVCCKTNFMKKSSWIIRHIIIVHASMVIYCFKYFCLIYVLGCREQLHKCLFGLSRTRIYAGLNSESNTITTLAQSHKQLHYILTCHGRHLIVGKNNFFIFFFLVYIYKLVKL